MAEYLFSFVEKYSLAFLQFLTTLFISRYFGVESLGMIAAFSLIVAVATVLAEAGSSYIIMGSTTDLAVNIYISLIFSLVTSLVLYAGIYELSSLYLMRLGGSNHYEYALRGYALIVIGNPIQLISYAGLIKLERTRALVYINLFAWSLSITVLYWLSLSYNRTHEIVVVYFIILSFLRALISMIVLIRTIGFVKFGFEKLRIRYRTSLMVSQIIHTISTNIWTYMVAIFVSIEANAILAVFTKVRDIVSGNLSHAIHRVVYSRQPGLQASQLKNYRLLWLKRFALLNTLLLCLLYIGRDVILELFKVKWTLDLDLFILFPLGVGLLYPLTDFAKSLIRFDNQQTALLVDSIVLITILVLFIVGSPIMLSMSIYLMVMLLSGMYILRRVV